MIIDLFGFLKSQDSVAQTVMLFSLPSCWQLEGGSHQKLVIENSVGCAQEGDLESVSLQESNGSPSA